jgi:hypothetical protein
VVVKDNTSVSQIFAEVMENDPDDQNYAPANRFNGYFFRVKFTVLGENLSNVWVSQDQKSSTQIWDFQGNLMTPDQTLNYVRGVTPDNANKPANMVNSNGEFVLDDGWDWAAFKDKNIKKGEATTQDNQSFGLTVAGGGTYCELATVSREFKFKTKNHTTGAELKVLNWKYTWSNDPCKWVATDNPAPPPPVTFCAKSTKNGGKGKFTNISGIQGLAGLN